MLVRAISISSFFSFWKLDYFSGMNCLKNTLPDMIWCCFSSQLVSSESDFDAGPIHWTLTPFRLEEFQLKVFQYVCYMIWKSHDTKIIVAMLLQPITLYIRIGGSVWHPNTEPKFFRTRFEKRLTPAEKFIFRIM